MWNLLLRIRIRHQLNPIHIDNIHMYMCFCSVIYIHLVSMVFPWVILFQRINLSNNRLSMLNMLITSITMKIMAKIGMNLAEAIGRDPCKLIHQMIMILLRIAISQDRRFSSRHSTSNPMMPSTWPIAINGNESEFRSKYP